MLFRVALRTTSGRDTAGLLALDTGAGYLALDRDLARSAGIADSVAASSAVELAQRPLPRLQIGALLMDQVFPVLTIDAEVVRRVSDRQVIGLLGQKPIASCLIWIDYGSATMALIPNPLTDAASASDTEWFTDATRTGGAGSATGAREAGDARVVTDSLVGRALSDPDGVMEGGGATGPGSASEEELAASRALLAGVLSPAARRVRFKLRGDGKILLRARVSDPSPPRYSCWLNLILDTGATKCAFFDQALEAGAPRSRAWASLGGLSAPSLVGVSDARVVRIPDLEVEADSGNIHVAGLDAAVMRSDLSEALAQAVGERVDGLLGYSWLRRFGVAIDYRHRVMWLDPRPVAQDERPYEYSHVGLQIERRDGALRVVGVVHGSPAGRAGISVGDEVLALDGHTVTGLGVVDLVRRLEGPPGTRISLSLRHSGAERTYRLLRRRLL